MLPEGWKTAKLIEMIKINSQSISSNYSHEEIEYIDTSSITQNILEPPQILKIKDAPSRAKRIVNAGDTIISTVRPIQKHYGFMKEPKKNTIVSTGFAVLTPKNIFPKFLYYYLTQDSVTEYLNGIAETTTTAYPAFSPDIFNTLQVEIPENIAEQRTIADVLSVLDDKIELNRRMNATLEDLAQTLFKHYFIDNPERRNWEETTLDYLAELVLGGDWGKEIQEDDFSIPAFCIRGADIPDLQIGGMGKMPLRYISESSFEKRSLKNGDIVVEISGGSPTQSTGRPVLISQFLLNRLDHILVCSNFCRFYRPRDVSLSFYIYYWLRSLYLNGELFQFETGTTGIKNLAFTVFCRDFKLSIPSKEIINVFNNLVTLFNKTMHNNAIQNEILTNLRDALIFCLMSGKVRVKGIKDSK